MGGALKSKAVATKKKTYQVAWSESKQSKNTELKGYLDSTDSACKDQIAKASHPSKKPQNNARSFARTENFQHLCVSYTNETSLADSCEDSKIKARKIYSLLHFFLKIFLK